MTWLELMDTLDKMPRHLLKREAELWHYDHEGNYEILPIDNIVSPLNDSDSESKEWGPGGSYGLSLQSFDDERNEPGKKKYLIQTSTILGQSFFIDADDKDDAREKARRLVNNCKFFDDHMHAKWSYDNEWDATEVLDVVDGWEPEAEDVYIAPEVVDSYLEEE